MKKFFLILLLVIAIIGVVFISLKKFFGSKAQEEIRSFETINLRISGMRVTQEYEILCRGGETEILLYQIFYANGKDERRLEKNAVVKTEKMIEILNSCGFSGWDGFNGEHPKNVSDGDMFRLEAVINDSEKIYAEGSANFPKGYSEFIKELNKLLNEN
ncbi:MAG: hypothetical protein IJ945_04325 [Oscillospiraceae bacterium]|nr:hypothetical protein [Oscillospiraceae bacterium]